MRTYKGNVGFDKNPKNAKWVVTAEKETFYLDDLDNLSNVVHWTKYIRYTISRTNPTLEELMADLPEGCVEFNFCNKLCFATPYNFPAKYTTPLEEENSVHFAG